MISIKYSVTQFKRPPPNPPKKKKKIHYHTHTHHHLSIWYSGQESIEGMFVHACTSRLFDIQTAPLLFTRHPNKMHEVCVRTHKHACHLCHLLEQDCRSCGYKANCSWGYWKSSSSPGLLSIDASYRLTLFYFICRQALLRRSISRFMVSE